MSLGLENIGTLECISDREKRKNMKMENFGNKKLWIYGENKILWKYNTRVIKYCGHTNGERKIVYKSMKKETIEKT